MEGDGDGPNSYREVAMLMQTLRPVEELADGGMEIERRAVVRYLCDLEVVYSRFSKRERLWARVRNVSINGIGLLLSARSRLARI
jgi:hypothetical protein